MKLVIVFFSSCMLLLTSCGGGDGGTAETPALTGTFVDSPVINIGYRTATQSGDTNSRGEFKYLAGETITFFIGDLEFPPVLAAELVTPLDIAETDDVAHPMVINIIRLLQSLDKDGNPSNGITITQTAKDNAVALDFDLSVSGFAAMSGLSVILANGGQDQVRSELVAISDAVLHLILTLALSSGFSDAPGFGEAPDFGEFVMGTWRGTHADRNFAMVGFFDDGTYIHAETGDLGVGEMSGMEWGTVSISANNFSQASQHFDNNSSLGLSPIKTTVPLAWVFRDDQIIGDKLLDNKVLAPIADAPSVLGSDAIQFRKIVSQGLLGTWRSTSTENDLLMIIFFDDGTYFHGEVDADDETEISGMELGTYTYNESTGLLTVTQTFDNNGDAGLTDFVGVGAPNMFVELSGDTLTATIDEDGDTLIDETIIFQRL